STLRSTQSTLFPYTTLFRSGGDGEAGGDAAGLRQGGSDRRHGRANQLSGVGYGQCIACAAGLRKPPLPASRGRRPGGAPAGQPVGLSPAVPCDLLVSAQADSTSGSIP